MPQIKSAIKRVQIAERNRLYNKSYKSAIHTLTKKVFAAADALAAGEASVEQLDTAMSAAVSKIDKAACKGVLHRNTANRRKARLSRVYKAATGQTAPAN
ncbi:30S ribosomal protein S20 [Synechococcus sp. PCC 7336]|uniref:30S ribosomal protein S20 n=1 Tax=Synechococcus sp. PCC 7336 TaxID=195250 RepID=UPI00034DB52D|nr:30S ribosomal protein S20 [Synechococcus sp. PCC 7336]